MLKPAVGADRDAALADVQAVLAGRAETPDLLFEPSDVNLTTSVDAVLFPGDSPRALERAARPTIPQPRTRVHVVMPIGVGAPGTPVLRHLRASLDCLARQTFRDFKVTVAADENISAEARALVEAYGADIVWYPKDTYFRPGGIWKKITDQWQAVDSDYVAYFHYDDLWDDDEARRAGGADRVAGAERLLHGRAAHGRRGRGDAGRHRAARARPVAGRHASGRVDAALDAAAPRRDPRLGPARPRAELGGDLRAAVLPLRAQAGPRREVHVDAVLLPRASRDDLEHGPRGRGLRRGRARPDGLLDRATLADAATIDLDGLVAQLVSNAA